MRYSLKKIRAIIHEYYGHCAIYLFGSTAKQQRKKNSDIDIFVIVDSDECEIIRGDQCKQQLARFAYKIDIRFYTVKEFQQAKKNPYSFLSSIEKSAVKIENFLEEIG
ncbi:MAG: nucleotidyltransferase domain-containing protein [Kangiellaceae bacterium]|nr:nucleotidyltransferase domain-containing protein [Kangiellaceae bacterium]